MSIPNEILNDLGTRFLIHLPQEEKQDPTRLCFQMEQAYWFYLDFYAGEGTTLPNVSMKVFTNAMFKHTPGLKSYAKRTDEIIDTWKQFKLAVPTYGCILVDTTAEYVLLVQGYCSRSSWGFPKGKVNENEKPHRCASREVYEETGYDCLPLINKKTYLERKFGDNLQRLYIVPGVSRDTLFLPQTRKEIRSIRWFNIKDLPTNKNDGAPMERLGIPPSQFFMVFPFVKPLRKWMEEYRTLMKIQSTIPPVALPLQSAFQPFAADYALQKTLAALQANVAPTLPAVPLIPSTAALPFAVPGILPAALPLIRPTIPGYPAAIPGLIPAVLPDPTQIARIETVITKKTCEPASSEDSTPNTITTVKTVISKKNRSKRKNDVARKSLDQLFENMKKLTIDEGTETVVMVSAVTSLDEDKHSKKSDPLTLEPYVYEAPTFTVPAWTDFKFNYQEYVDLVY